jgi:DNA processing protein
VTVEECDTPLRLAVTAVKHGGGPQRVAKEMRARGLQGLTDVYERLEPDQRRAVSAQAEELTAHGVRVTFLGSEDYPRLLMAIRAAPPVLFYRGNSELLNTPSVGICGSRDVSEEGQQAARMCGEVGALSDLTVVSGYARGVDMAAHSSALGENGRTVVVLPEGILKFRLKREIANRWNEGRTLVISQFPPSQSWSAGGAMSRNTVILGMSLALVVVEARDKGGTFAAGETALNYNRRVVALEFSTGQPRGNAVLLSRGAVPIRSRSELVREFSSLATNSEGRQLSIL